MTLAPTAQRKRRKQTQHLSDTEVTEKRRKHRRRLEPNERPSKNIGRPSLGLSTFPSISPTQSISPSPSSISPAQSPSALVREDSHPFDDDEPRTPERAAISAFPTSPQEPGAPNRQLHRERRRWLDSLLNSDLPTLLQLEESDDGELSCPVFTEWLVWRLPEVPADEELTTPALLAARQALAAADVGIDSSEYAWLPPLHLAARWGGPQVVQWALARANHQTLNHLGQNALVALCAQPQFSMLVVGALAGHACPDMFKQITLSCWPGSSRRCAQEIQSEKDIAGLRKREMKLTAELLLSEGVSCEEPDAFGLTAKDYARIFGHLDILAVFVAHTETPPVTESAKQVSHTVIAATPPRTVRTPGGMTMSPASEWSMASIDSSLPTGYDLSGVCHATKRWGSRLAGSKLAGSRLAVKGMEAEVLMREQILDCGN